MLLNILLQASNFGITEIDALYQAGIKAAEALQKVAIPVVGIALLLRFFTFLTKIFTEQEVNFVGLGKSFLLILFLFNYGEVMGQVNNLISYFTDSTQSLFGIYGSGNTLVDKMNKVYEAYEKNHPVGMFDFANTPFIDWLLANLSHMIILIAKSITEIVRSLIMLFLYATGPIAILISLFPSYEDNLKTFFKYYISIGFWAVTLGVLDLLLFHYLDWCEKTGSIDGITTINVGMTIMYLMAPYLTSRYIGGQGSQFMSRMIQNATTAVTMGKMAMVSKVIGGGGAGGKGGGGSLMSSLANKAGIPSVEKMTETVARPMGSAFGQAYGAVKNNFIKKNQAE